MKPRCAPSHAVVVAVGLALWLGPTIHLDGAATNSVAAREAAGGDLVALQTVVGACQSLQEQLQTALKTVTELNRSNAAASGRELQSVFERLKVVGQGLATQHQQLEQHSIGITRATGELQQQLGKQLELLDRFQRTQDELQKRLQAVSLEAAQAQTGLKNEAAQRQRLEQQSLAAASTNAELNQRVRELLLQQSVIERNGEQLTGRLQHATEQVARAAADLQLAHAARLKLEQDLAQAAGSNAAMRIELSADERVVMTLQHDRDALEKRLGETAAELQRTKEELEKQLARGQSELVQSRSFTRGLLLTAALLVVVALAAAGFMVWVQVRGTGRRAVRFGPLAPMVARPPAARPAFCPEPSSSRQAAPDPGVPPHPSPGTAAFNHSLAQVQHRLEQLERSLSSEPAASPHSAAVSPSAPLPAASESAQPGAPPTAQGTAAGCADALAHAVVLVQKAQALMNLGQVEAALSSLDEALGLNPQNAEALVKRGAALEKLGRLEDAAASYDRAIVAEPSLTNAYLLKGGVLNRLRRYDEALKCYDQALRAQAVPPPTA